MPLTVPYQSTAVSTCVLYHTLCPSLKAASTCCGLEGTDVMCMVFRHKNSVARDETVNGEQQLPVHVSGELSSRHRNILAATLYCMGNSLPCFRGLARTHGSRGNPNFCLNQRLTTLKRDIAHVEYRSHRPPVRQTSKSAIVQKSTASIPVR